MSFAMLRRWICRSCRHEFTATANSACFGCRACGAHNVETFLPGAGWVGPTDQRLPVVKP